jgi:hypothetical protein
MPQSICHLEAWDDTPSDAIGVFRAYTPGVPRSQALHRKTAPGMTQVHLLFYLHKLHYSAVLKYRFPIWVVGADDMCITVLNCIQARLKSASG